MSTSENPSVDVTDPSELYYLNERELAFFQSQTGIQDEDELKKHIVNVQQEALKVVPYHCIKAFAFTKLIASRLPAYNQLVTLGKERKGAILLDIGCCFGIDVRKAVADGFPPENIIGSDLCPEYWDLGHTLFRTSPKDLPAHFVGGDAFNPEFFGTAPPFYSPPETPPPALSSLTTLTPLQGHVSVIHASSFFHLFNEARQTELAFKLAGLLSPEPGSVIIGLHVGRPEKGLRTEGRVTRTGELMFCHSPESWKELWDGQVFKKGTVKVEATLHSVGDTIEMEKWLAAARRANLPGSAKQELLLWSVTRL